VLECKIVLGKLMYYAHSMGSIPLPGCWGAFQRFILIFFQSTMLSLS